MWVVKLGGSLADSVHLQSWLNALAEHGPGRIVIVPGGGPFADAVRLAQIRQAFPDDCAHAMALLAMHQYGIMLRGLCPRLTVETDVMQLVARLKAGECVIWLPDLQQLDAAAIPASWAVTSDSLAAWLAGQITASNLLLVKSASIKTDATLEQLHSQGIVDTAFMEYLTLPCKSQQPCPPLPLGEGRGEGNWLNSRCVHWLEAEQSGQLSALLIKYDCHVKKLVSQVAKQD